MESDSRKLARLGYAQELLRRLGGFSSFAIGFSVISVLTGVNSAFGDALTAGGPAGPGLGWPLVSCDALLADPAAQHPMSEYRSIYRGLIVSAGFETGTYGQAIPGMAGAETAGVKSFAGRQVLLTWDAAGGLAGGYGGNEHPGFWFIGGRLNLRSELGYRFAHQSALSPYAGAGAELAFSAAGVPSTPAGGPNAMNNLDGLAGSSGTLATRYSFGGSYLSARHAWQLTAFAHEALRAPASWAKSALYFEFGVHAQYDLSQSLSLMAEALYGRTGRKSEDSFDSTTEARHIEALLVVKKMFSKGLWVALDGELTEDGNETTYAGSPMTYVTSWPLAPSVGVTLGIPVE